MGEASMSIERDENIVFDDLGTLIASTRWISTHDEGIAEWMKNARLAYQIDGANVIDADRVSVLLLKDIDQRAPARIGLLDVGGAAIEDIERWSKWNDPRPSSRGPHLPDEETQGNGGKAYMYSMFSGPARLVHLVS
jgi:hypothetical protein